MMIVLRHSGINAFNDWRWLAAVLLLSFISIAHAASFMQTGRRVEVGGFLTPESVAVGPDGRYYVSNIGQFNVPGDGSIKAIAGNPFDGAAMVSHVATGLNDPKGIVFVGNDLFVADVNQVWRVITSGQMAGEKSVFLAPAAFPGGAQFL